MSRLEALLTRAESASGRNVVSWVEVTRTRMLVQRVDNAPHQRSSFTFAGQEMGRKIGELTVATKLRPRKN